MSARTPLEDAHRSFRRWVSGVLGETLAGEEWRVLMAEQAVPDEERPCAVVAAATPSSVIQYRTSIPQGDVRMQQTFVATVYPELLGLDGKSLAPSLARQRATQIQQALQLAMMIGLENEDGTALSAAMEVPLYDYEGLDPTTAGPDDPYGRLEAQGADCEAIPDPQDDRRWTVVLSCMVRWFTPGRGWAGGPEPPTPEAMPGSFSPIQP